MAHYDLAIIGTGSGNSLVTSDFEDRKVAVIEQGAFGGTCLNVGCIPTKMFVYAADVAATVADAARFGIDAHLDGVRWNDIRDRVFGVIDPIAEAGKQYRVDSAHTDAFLGRAKFIGERALAVRLNNGAAAELTADEIVIATGARPSIPAVIADSGVPFVTSDTIMRLPQLPRSLIIFWAGVVACEFAHVFAQLGVQVSILARGPRLLRSFDEELAQAFTDHARTQWNVNTQASIAGLEAGPGGVEVTLTDGTKVNGEMLLVAAGRTPNTDDLGCDQAAVARDQAGRVIVDAYGRTSAEGVWALGDACSPVQLKHVANQQARAVAHNIAHPESLRPFALRNVPQAVFSHPQVACIGATQEQLQRSGRPFISKVQAYGDTAYGWAMQDSVGMCKVLADPSTGELLGTHIMGAQASTLIQPAIMAMSLGIPVQEVTRGQYWIHPALTEVLENALLGVQPH